MVITCEEKYCGCLAHELSDEEIKKVMFNMPNDKSPGADRFISKFLKVSWSIVGKDFTVAIQSFFVKMFLLKEVNSKILVLISKKSKAKTKKDYRQIS